MIDQKKAIEQYKAVNILEKLQRKLFMVQHTEEYLTFSQPQNPDVIMDNKTRAALLLNSLIDRVYSGEKEGMPFSLALEALKQGMRVNRKISVGAYLTLFHDKKNEASYPSIILNGDSEQVWEQIWGPSFEDLLAEDWQIVE